MANQPTAFGSPLPKGFGSSLPKSKFPSSSEPIRIFGTTISGDSGEIGGYTGPEGGRTISEVVTSIPGTVEGLIKGAIGFAFGGSTATVAATYHGLRTGEWDEFKPVFDHIYNDTIMKFPKILGVKLTQAQTESGERVLTMLDKEVFQRIHKWAEALGEWTFQRTNNPALATFARTATEGIGLLTPIIGTRAVAARPRPKGAKPLTKWEKAKTFGIEEGIAYKISKQFPGKRYGIPKTKLRLPPLGAGAEFKWTKWEKPWFENNKTPGLVVSFESFKQKVLAEHPKMSLEAIDVQYRQSHEVIRDYLEREKRQQEADKPVALESGVEVHTKWNKMSESAAEGKPPDLATLAEIQALSVLRYGEFRAREGVNPKTGKDYAKSTIDKKFVQYANKEYKKWYEGSGRRVILKNVDEAVLALDAITEAKKIGRLVKTAQSRIPANLPKEIASEILSLIQPAVVGKSNRIYTSNPKRPSMYEAAREALNNGEEVFTRGYFVKNKDGTPTFYPEAEIMVFQEIAARGKSIAETNDIKYLKNLVENSDIYKTDIAKAVKKQFKETVFPKTMIARGAKGVVEGYKKQKTPPNTGEDVINPYLKTIKEIYRESGLDVEEIFTPKKSMPEQVTKAVDVAGKDRLPAEAWEEAAKTHPSTIIAKGKPSALVNEQMPMWRHLIHIAGGRAISFWKTDNKLRDVLPGEYTGVGAGVRVPGPSVLLRDISRAFAEIMDSLWRPEAYSDVKKVMDSYHSSRHTRAGEFQQRLLNAWYPLRAKWFPHIQETFKAFKGNPEVNIPLTEYLTNPNTKMKVPPLIKIAGDAIRKILDDFHTYAKKVFPDLEYHRNWLPRTMDWKWAERHRAAAEDIFTNIFQKYPDSLARAKENFGNVNAAREAAISFVDHIILNKGSIQISPELLSAKEIMAEGRFRDVNEAKLVAKKAGSLDFERVFKDVPDLEFGKLLDPSVFKRVQRYIEDGAARVEYARINGPNSELLYNRIHRAAEELQAAGRPLRQQEVEHLVNLWSAFQGIYKSNTAKWWVKTQKAYITLLNMALLPLATVASMPESALPYYHGGLKAYRKALPQELFVTLPTQIARAINRDWKGREKDKTRSMLMVEAINKAGDIAAMERANQLFAGDFTIGNNVLFRANGLFYWTKWMNHLAVSTFDFMAQDYFTRKAQGKKSGLRPEEEIRMEKLMDYYDLPAKEGIQWVKDGAKLEGPFFEKFKKAALIFAEDSVLTPNPAIVPLWHSHPGFAMVKHLKAFPTLIGNTVLRRWGADTFKAFHENGIPLQGRNATYAVSTGMIMILLAHLSNVITDQIRYGEENPFYKQTFKDDRYRWLIRAVERWGIMGPAQFGLDALFHSHGTGKLAVFLGPGFNKAERFASAALSGNARTLGRELSRITPVGNVRDEWREGLADMYTQFISDNMGFDIKDSSGRRARTARTAR